jgi:hypothetical protein
LPFLPLEARRRSRGHDRRFMNLLRQKLMTERWRDRCTPLAVCSAFAPSKSSDNNQSVHLDQKHNDCALASFCFSNSSAKSCVDCFCFSNSQPRADTTMVLLSLPFELRWQILCGLFLLFELQCALWCRHRLHEVPRSVSLFVSLQAWLALNSHLPKSLEFLSERGGFLHFNSAEPRGRVRWEPKPIAELRD